MLVCGCDDYPDVSSLYERKARKQHKCCECGKQIRKGEIYYVYNSCWEGEWLTSKTCEPCQDLGESMAAMGFCWVIGDLREAHQEYLNEYAPPKLTWVKVDA